MEAMRTRLDRTKVPAGDPPPDAIRPAPATASALPRRDRVEHDVHVYRLASGVPVLVRPRPGTHILYAGVLALGGASGEDDTTAGRTLLMARTAVKGTERRTALQIAEAAELLGGSVSASVSGETVGWTVSVPVAHAAAAIELLADVAQHPTFANDALETERAVALADVAATRDDMYRFPAMLATRAAFAGHPYGVPVIGTEASLTAMTRDALAAWHRERFLHANSVTVVVGDGDPDALAGIVSRHFGELAWREASAMPSPRWPTGIVQQVEHREKAQTAVVLSWPAPSRADDDRFAIAMLSGIASGLGGRLFEELRDRQSLCYTVHAYGAERRVAGTFNAYIATSPEKEDRAREGLLAELGKFRDDIVGDDELRRAQTYALGTHAIRQQSGAAVLSEVADAWLFGSLAELSAFEAQVRAVTPTAIREVARRYLDAGQRVEGIVRGVGKTV
jgi:zinc protease